MKTGYTVRKQEVIRANHSRYFGATADGLDTQLASGVSSVDVPSSIREFDTNSATCGDYLCGCKETFNSFVVSGATRKLLVSPLGLSVL